MKFNNPLHILTDLKSIFEPATASKCLFELCLKSNIAGIRYAYGENKISSVVWICSWQNVAVNFIQNVANDILDSAMFFGCLDIII